MTASISAAVWPRAPALAMARARVMLVGEKTMFVWPGESAR